MRGITPSGLASNQEIELGARASIFMDIENSAWAYRFWWMTDAWWWDEESRSWVRETRPEMLGFPFGSP